MEKENSDYPTRKYLLIHKRLIKFKLFENFIHSFCWRSDAWDGSVSSEHACGHNDDGGVAGAGHLRARRHQNRVGRHRWNQL